jgi:hypothetical protein
MHFPLLDTTSGAASGAILYVFAALALVATVFYIVCYWRVFSKAGKPGWLAIIPLVNFIVLLNIVGRSAWWLVLLLIPGVDAVFILIFSLVIYWDLGKAFGKGAGFRLGLMFLHAIFIAILAFGSAQYVGARPTAMPIPQYR